MFLTNETFHPTKKTNIGLLWNDSEKELNANEYYVGDYGKVHDHQSGKSMCA